MKRYLESVVQELAFANSKMAFIAGPRQVGKTTLALSIARGQGLYANWDEKAFRKAWTKDPLSYLRESQRSIVILDEIHKARAWKRDLKGIYDHTREEFAIIVTGSARLNVYKRGGDSLLGRYMLFRLHPLSLGELVSARNPEPSNLLQINRKALGRFASEQGVLLDLLVYGGFPEPFLKKSKKFHRIWQSGRLEKIVREDLRDLSRLPELSQIEMLVSLMPERAARPLSVQALREDLEVAHTTVSRWLRYLSYLYYHYELRPWSKRIKNSLKKEAKLFLWDWSEVENDGACFENLLASHLLKACHYWTDTGEGRFDLYYVRNKQKEEVDFLICKNNKPFTAIEAKITDAEPSRALRKFSEALGLETVWQITRQDGVCEERYSGKTRILVCSANVFLQLLP